MTKYIKYRLTSKRYGVTLGVVISQDVYNRLSFSDLSLAFPIQQAQLMKQVECSPPYDSTEHAFAHEFDKGVG